MTSGFAWANSRKSENAISRQRSSVRAVTVARTLDAFEISAELAEVSPAASVATSTPATLTAASPSVTTKKPMPLIEPSRTTSIPGLNVRSRKLAASFLSLAAAQLGEERDALQIVG